MESLTWSLRDPGLTALQRCGIGAMALTLRAAADLGHDLAPLVGSFDNDNESVVLGWPEDSCAREALSKLIEFAWQARQPTTEDGLGVLYLPQVHTGAARDSYPSRLVENNGILSTFLQHPRVQPKTKPATRQRIDIDDERHYEVVFVEPKGSLKYVADFSGKLFDSNGAPRAVVALSQFIVPGGTARHGGEESWEGSAIEAIPLFFAPTVCFYLRAQSFSWVVAVPDISDLAEFVDIRPMVRLSWKEAEIRSLADAGLRVAVAYRTQTPARRLGLTGLEIMRVGKVAWNRQNVRAESYRLRPSGPELDAFEIVLRHLPNRYRARKDGDGGFFSVPTPRGCISENLAAGKYWYRALFDVPREDREEVKAARKDNESAERAWFRLLGSERNALIAITKEMPMEADQELDRLFMDAIHEAMKRRFAQEAEHAKRGSRSVYDRWDDVIESERRRLGRSNTRSTLRTTLAEFFANAGGSATLRENALDIWSFIDAPETWRRARDLALLSLVTYQGKRREQSDEEGEPTASASRDN